MTRNPAPLTRLMRQEMRCVLVIDVVESVRLMAADEADTVIHWLAIVAHVRDVLLPREAGLMVRSLGDGMLMQFDDAPSALRVALGCRAFTGAQNAAVAEARRLRLRQGLEVTDVLVGPDDIYGHGVNMASRLAGLGEPDDIVISQEVRDRLTPGIHADIEDMGECFVKHLITPIRAYRAGPPDGRARRPVPVISGFGNVLPVIAVIPFGGGGAGADVAGEVLAEELIGTLSRSTQMNVISRLTTTQLSHEGWTARNFGERLRANFVLTGTCREYQGQLSANLELAETRGDEVVWADHVRGSVGDLLSGDQAMVAEIVDRIGSAILRREIERAGMMPLPNLEAYSLLLGAIGAMYRLSKGEFERGKLMLDALIDRVPRHPLPMAWLGNWHVLRVQQGWTDDAEKDRLAALARTNRALDIEPDNPHALTFEGFIHTNLSRRLDIAEERYDAAIASNPNAGYAWLLKGMLHAFRGEGAPAVAHSERAQSLSPLDPQKFFYDCLTAAAYLASGDYETALRYAVASLRANRTHTSTLRILAVTQWKLGQHPAARQTVRELMTREPDLTMRRWAGKNPGASSEHGKDIANTLRLAGVPD